MIRSKEWNWAVVKENFWNVPSEDVYFYLNRWSLLNFKSFLDIGCGLGRHSLLFAENGFNTYSLDLSEYAMDELREKSKERGLSLNLKLGNFNELPYDSNHFDCLLAYHVISHTDSDGIHRIIGEIKRVLKSNGEFFITLCSKCSPSYSRESNIVVDSNTIIKMEEPEVNIPHYYCDLEDVKILLNDFEIMRIRHIQDIFENTSSWHYFVHGKKKL